MSTKRDVLAHLTRDELIAVVDRFSLPVPDRRVREGLVEAVAASKKATLAEILPGYSRDRLKELCRALGLDDGGKEKAPIVERIVGLGLSHDGEEKDRKGARDAREPEESSVSSGPLALPAPLRSTRSPSAKGAARSGSGGVAAPVEIAPGVKLTIDALERYLWSAADAC